MKKLSLLYAGVLYASLLSAQPSFQTSLEAGISLPLNSNNINATHAGKAIHFGNHLDYSFGNTGLRFGIGAYVGYINSLSADGKYKQVGEAIAEKYRFAPTGLTFTSGEFKSTHILIGPVASFGSDNVSINIWAKGGYGLNEPSRYAVVYRDNGVANNVYVNQGGEHKNGLAYNAGAGIKLAMSEYAGFELSAGYFSTQTDQINYNFDREKGTTPLYYTASNQFIQVSAGLRFTIGNAGRKNNNVYGSAADGTDYPAIAQTGQKIKTKSNIKNDRVASPAAGAGIQERQINKSKSNVKNNRQINGYGNDTDDNAVTDSLLFTPEKIELRSGLTDAANRIQLQSVDNYLTGFAYQVQNGAMISQCGISAMPGEPIPGIDVKLKRAGTAANDILTARTNKDGSFVFNNVAAGNYIAEAGNNSMEVTVNGSKDNVFKTLDIAGGSCGDTKQNYIITAGDKTYVEVVAAREAGSGMATGKKQVANIKWNDISTVSPRDAGSGLATGKRMHKPYLTSDMAFEINQGNIVTSDGKLYAEVIAAREAGSGMATGRRMIVTGDVDGDGFEDNAVVPMQDAGSGLATGKRMHKPYVITTELEPVKNNIVTPRDAASGLPTGRRMHKPFVVTVDEDEEAEEIVSPRDASSGLPTGRRMHKPYVISIDPDADTYEVISPRDAGSGLPTGKRMHKPFVITKEIGIADDGGDVVTYRIIHRDIAARNVLLAGADEENTDDEKGSAAPAGKWLSKKGYDHYKASSDMAAAGVTSNPLYEESGNSAANPLFKPGAAKSVNPLYQTGGNQGSNPMNEAKNSLQVMGSNGIEHAIFIPDNLQIQPGATSTIAPFTQYELVPIKWMSPESISARKGITQSGIKKTDEAARKGWDGSVKGSGKGINEAGIKVTEDAAAKKGINQSGIKLTDDAARKGWDGTVKGGSLTDNEASARKGWDGTVKGGSIVQRIDRFRCADGTCAVEAIVEVDGIAYEAVITGVLKTKHDTVKNSVGNIR